MFHHYLSTTLNCPKLFPQPTLSLMVVIVPAVWKTSSSSVTPKFFLKHFYCPSRIIHNSLQESNKCYSRVFWKVQIKTPEAQASAIGIRADGAHKFIQHKKYSFFKWRISKQIIVSTSCLSIALTLNLNIYGCFWKLKGVILNMSHFCFTHGIFNLDYLW